MKIFAVAILIFFMQNAKAQLYALKQFDEVNVFFDNTNDTLYVVNFWATWCKPCIEELPYFEKLYSDYQNKPVKIILISLDTEKQWEGSLVPFLEKTKLSPEIWIMPNRKPMDWIDQINPEWQGSIPATFIFNNHRKIKFFEEQPLSYEQLKNILIENNYLTN